MAKPSQSRDFIARRIGGKRADQMKREILIRLVQASTGLALALTLTLALTMTLALPLRAQDSQSQPAEEASPAAAAQTPPAKAKPPHDPNIGEVTQLPLPRFVSLKTNEGNARRGPGLTHRIDWVFTHSGMPLRVTAEYENWRRVEDADGAGGWVHYSLLSSGRTALVTQDMTEFHSEPKAGASVAFQAEYGVIGRLLACNIDWCRISVDGEKGWALKTALWGISPTETVE